MNGVSTYSLYKFSQKFLLSRVSFFPHLTTISKIIEHITTCKNLNGKVIFSYSHSIIEIVFYDYTSNLYYRTSKTRMFVIHWTSDFTENRCYAAFRCYTVSQWVFFFHFPRLSYSRGGTERSKKQSKRVHCWLFGLQVSMGGGSRLLSGDPSARFSPLCHAIN